LPGGEVDAAGGEERGLDRMERLRRYQLAHPEAVTDAMNRLAQALVCLTDRAAKAAYDATLRPATEAVRATVAVQEEPPGPYPLAGPEPTEGAPIVRAPRPSRPWTPVRPRHAGDERRPRCRRLAATRRLLAAWRDVGEYISEPA